MDGPYVWLDYAVCLPLETTSYSGYTNGILGDGVLPESIDPIVLFNAINADLHARVQLYRPQLYFTTQYAEYVLYYL